MGLHGSVMARTCTAVCLSNCKWPCSQLLARPWLLIGTGSWFVAGMMQMWQQRLVSTQGCAWATRYLTSQSARNNLDCGLWQVSSCGRCSDSRGVISYGFSHPSGYSVVHIAGSKFRVHRLVALAFLGPPPDEKAWQVHHRDGDPSNNHVDNLEWVTPSQNSHYSHQDPLRGSAGPLQEKPVRWRKLG